MLTIDPARNSSKSRHPPLYQIQRIPILPAISKSHHVSSSEDFYLGDVFDIALLSDSIHHPVLEWADVKRRDSVEEELLGCWAPW